MIARFRKRHRCAFEALFAEVLKLCIAAGVVRLGVVALDGTKVKANASLAANRTAKSLEAEVAAMVSEAEETDATEDAMFGDQRGDEMPAGLREPCGRLARLRSCLDRLRADAAEKADAQQEKIHARAAAEKATGKAKRGRKPKPAEAPGANGACTAPPTTSENCTRSPCAVETKGENGSEIEAIGRNKPPRCPKTISRHRHASNIEPFSNRL